MRQLPEHLAVTDNPRKTYYDWVLGKARELIHQGDAIVLMAHEAVSESSFRDQEKYNFNFTEIDDFGYGYNYLALGHIHRPMTIFESADRIAAYSGSPLPLSFDEDYSHSVTVVEFENPKLAPKLRRIEISPLRSIVTLPEDNPLEESEVEDYVRFILHNGTKGYLRLNVSSARPLPSLHARLRNMMAETDIRFCIIKYFMATDPQYENFRNSPQLSIQDLRTIDPMTLALNYYRRKTGTEMDEEMRQCLLNIIND